MMDVSVPPYRTNKQLAAIALGIVALQLAIIPMFALPQGAALAGAVAVLLSLSTPFTRALLHEAIHGRLVRRKDWNTRLGRALAIGTGISFDAIRLGHMTHHRFPRHVLDRADIVEPGSSRFVAGINFYGGLLGGLYLREILTSVVMLLPRRAIDFVAAYVMVEDDALNNALRRGLDRRLARIRIDSAFVIAIYAVAFYLYGAWWPVLLMAIALRGLIVSLQDNVAHYDTPPVVGAAAHNSRTVRWARLFMLNQNLHGIHHDHPEVPWNRLPVAFDRAGSNYSGGYFALLLKQFYGPLPADAVALEVTVERDDPGLRRTAA